ncbi:MAG: DNA-processing protein DprA, partial [Gemmataceae bacterium]
MAALPAEVRDLLALQMIEGLGPQRIRALFAHFGTLDRIRHASIAELTQVPGIGDATARTIHAELPAVDIAAEVDRLERAGVRVLAPTLPGYPATLRPIPSAPLLLFARGEITAADERAVALVGTRHVNTYGRRVAQTLAAGLARAGVAVVSGLARGVDGICHRAALDAGGRTLAVLAGGLSRIYPPEHTDLAAAIPTAGAVLTEATMTQPPTQWRFPARNRIISGLSRVIVIVQAPTGSGALITADHAAEQGKLVMAVPGGVDDEQHAGCHRLLRDGAVLCRGVDDILEELDGFSNTLRQRDDPAPEAVPQPAPPPPPPPRTGPPPGLDDTGRRIWELLADGSRAIDEIAQQLALAVPPLTTALM